MQLQIALIFLLSILTVTIVAVSVYFIMILKEVRETVRRTNEIIGDVENVVDAVSHPAQIIMGALQAYKSIKSLKDKD